VNIELYIQSGIVESYALGLATPFEAAEFEQLLPHFPELREALSEFEYHLELFSIDNEVPPPPEVKERIKARIRETPGEHTRREKKGSEYIPVEVSTPYIRVHKRWRTFFIIVFILSKILLALAIYYFLEYRHTQNHVLQLEEQLGKRVEQN
jgi:anti-sigma-K factor RskA